MVLMLVQAGLDIEFVVDQDIFSFNSLIEAHHRLLAQEKIEQAQTAQLASQGTGKDLVKWLKKKWFPLLGSSSRKGKGNDAEAFKRKFGKGI